MQMRKLHEKQGIKPAMKQTSAETRIIALEAWLRINPESKKGDVKLKGETPKNQCGVKSKGVMQ